jgi:pantoate--beta-alanine ligase
MVIFTRFADLHTYLTVERRAGRRLGFVPTMGALHAGHLTLIAASKAANDRTVCSIFVNPAQFNNAEDLARYPRTLEADCALLEGAGCDAVFAPSAEEMYPEPPHLRFDFGNLERILEGAFRPGHFNGVGLVVSKLFHLVQPDRAYFGQKDLQQCLIVKRLVEELNFPLELVIVPTVREADGLAMSSRNRRLTPEERALAPVLYRILSDAKRRLEAGEAAEAVQTEAFGTLAAQGAFRPEYLEIVEARTLEPLTGPLAGREAAVCVAAFLGPVRLIDNVLVGRG